MDKQKQIEEMAQCKNEYGFICCDCVYRKSCERYSLAEELYKAGYRKIPEGAVVLTGGQYEEVLKLLKEYNKIQQNFPNQVNAMMENYNKGYEKGSKETAEKFAESFKQRMKDKYQGSGIWWTEIVLMAIEICKEITEEGKCQK